MKKQPVDQITLFDRLALAVGGGVVGYISGFALGWAAFLFLGMMAAIEPTPASGKVFFYYVPVVIALIGAAGFAVLPKYTAALLARVWQVVLALSRRF